MKRKTVFLGMLAILLASVPNIQAQNMIRQSTMQLSDATSTTNFYPVIEYSTNGGTTWFLLPADYDNDATHDCEYDTNPALPISGLCAKMCGTDGGGCPSVNTFTIPTGAFEGFTTVSCTWNDNSAWLRVLSHTADDPTLIMATTTAHVGAPISKFSRATINNLLGSYGGTRPNFWLGLCCGSERFAGPIATIDLTTYNRINTSAVDGTGLVLGTTCNVPTTPTNFQTVSGLVWAAGASCYSIATGVVVGDTQTGALRTTAVGWFRQALGGTGNLDLYIRDIAY